MMRNILILALAAPLFAACAVDGGPAVNPTNANQGAPERALRAAQPGAGQNAGGGVATVTGQMGDGGGRPTIERGPAPPGSGVGCPPGTRVVVMPTTRGDRPEVTCQ